MKELQQGIRDGCTWFMMKACPCRVNPGSQLSQAILVLGDTIIVLLLFLKCALVLKRVEIDTQETGSIWSLDVAEKVKICVGDLGV